MCSIKQSARCFNHYACCDPPQWQQPCIGIMWFAASHVLRPQLCMFTRQTSRTPELHDAILRPVTIYHMTMRVEWRKGGSLEAKSPHSHLSIYSMYRFIHVEPF